MKLGDPGFADEVGVMPTINASYKEALGWLYGTQRFGIKLGLENIQRLLHELNLPLNGIPVLHVAGTNGKGSVCAMLDSVCRAEGYRSGLFTSPHLMSYRERIRVNGELITEDEVSKGLTLIRELIQQWEPHPTFFEITTALALLHFTNHACNLLVLETGLGGRLDATNAIQPVVSVITPIGFDHQSWLGNTLEQIAGEKAGIIKPHTPVVSAIQEPAADKVIRARANACDAPLLVVRATYEATPIALPGAYQKQNAALATAALQAGGIAVREESVAKGFAQVDWPARFQRWDQRTIVDGAHNPAGAHVLAQTWRQEFGSDCATTILAVLQDKDIAGICEALVPITGCFVLPRIRSQRAIEPAALAQVLSTIAPTVRCSITDSIAEALQLARNKLSPILVTGSLHFAGEMLATLKGEPAAFEECAQ